jgi:anti-sigma regulatory factor (Ser/Thr protein kinase)
MLVAGAPAETRSFPATPAAVTEMDDWMGTISERWSLGARCLYRARSCVAELAANVLEHGGINPATDRIEIGFGRLTSGVELVFTAAGVPFNTATARPLEASDRIGGRGLRIVHSYASSIDYRWLDGRNVVTLHLAG